MPHEFLRRMWVLLALSAQALPLACHSEQAKPTHAAPLPRFWLAHTTLSDPPITALPFERGVERVIAFVDRSALGVEPCQSALGEVVAELARDGTSATRLGFTRRSWPGGCEPP